MTKINILFTFLALHLGTASACNTKAEKAAAQTFSLSFEIEHKFKIVSRTLQESTNSKMDRFEYILESGNSYPDYEIVMLEAIFGPYNYCYVESTRMLLKNF